MDFSETSQFWASYVALGFLFGTGWRLSCVVYPWLYDKVLLVWDWITVGLDNLKEWIASKVGR